MLAGMLRADSDETKTMRPQPRAAMAGASARDRRTPLITLVCQCVSQTASSASKKSFGP